MPRPGGPSHAEFRGRASRLRDSNISWASAPLRSDDSAHVAVTNCDLTGYHRNIVTAFKISAHEANTGPTRRVRRRLPDPFTALQGKVLKSFGSWIRCCAIAIRAPQRSGQSCAATAPPARRSRAPYSQDSETRRRRRTQGRMDGGGGPSHVRHTTIQSTALDATAPMAQVQPLGKNLTARGHGGATVTSPSAFPPNMCRAA